MKEPLDFEPEDNKGSKELNLKAIFAFTALLFGVSSLVFLGLEHFLGKVDAAPVLLGASVLLGILAILTPDK